MMASPSRVGFMVAIVLIAACNSDTLVTPPRETEPDGSLQATKRVVVIDSTSLPFAGTAADRAAGHYVFAIKGSVPAIAAGDYLAGRQGGLFLGSVLSVKRDRDRLAVELAPAAVEEVFRAFDVHIPFAGGAGSAQSSYGLVRWGAWQLAPATAGAQPSASSRASSPRVTMPFHTSRGTLASADNFDPFNFLLDNFDLCAASEVIEGCGNISAKIVNATFSLTGDLDVGVDISLSGADIHAIVNENFDAGVVFELAGHGSVGVDVPIPEVSFVRPFKVGDIWSGVIEMGVFAQVEGNITGTTVQPYVAIGGSNSIGARASTDNGFEFVYDPEPRFDAGVKVIDLGDLGVKLGVGPVFKVKIEFPDGPGFTLDLRGSRYAEASENLPGLLGLENWHFHFAVGEEAQASGVLDVPFFGWKLGGQVTFPVSHSDLVDMWGTGDLLVVSSTTGKDIFPGQLYQTGVTRTVPSETPAWYAVYSRTLGVNDYQLLRGGLLCGEYLAGAPLIGPFIGGPRDCDIVATSHAVGLTGWAWNCSAGEALPAQVHVRPRNPFDFSERITRVVLDVVCRSAYAVVRDRVWALRAAGAIDLDGIATALSAKLTAAEMARDVGDVAGADSAIQDLMNQLRAQNGKHITLAADAELQGLALLLRTCYETVVPTCSTLTVPPAVAAL